MTSQTQKRANLTKPGGGLTPKSAKAKRAARKAQRLRERDKVRAFLRDV